MLSALSFPLAGAATWADGPRALLARPANLVVLRPFAKSTREVQLFTEAILHYAPLFVMAAFPVINGLSPTIYGRPDLGL